MTNYKDQDTAITTNNKIELLLRSPERYFEKLKNNPENNEFTLTRNNNIKYDTPLSALELSNKVKTLEKEIETLCQSLTYTDEYGRERRTTQKLNSIFSHCCDRCKDITTQVQIIISRWAENMQQRTIKWKISTDWEDFNDLALKEWDNNSCYRPGSQWQFSPINLYYCINHNYISTFIVKIYKDDQQIGRAWGIIGQAHPRKDIFLQLSNLYIKRIPFSTNTTRKIAEDILLKNNLKLDHNYHGNMRRFPGLTGTYTNQDIQIFGKRPMTLSKKCLLCNKKYKGKFFLCPEDEAKIKQKYNISSYYEQEIKYCQPKRRIKEIQEIPIIDEARELTHEEFERIRAQIENTAHAVTYTVIAPETIINIDNF